MQFRFTANRVSIRLSQAVLQTPTEISGKMRNIVYSENLSDLIFFAILKFEDTATISIF